MDFNTHLGAQIRCGDAPETTEQTLVRHQAEIDDKVSHAKLSMELYGRLGAKVTGPNGASESTCQTLMRHGAELSKKISREELEARLRGKVTPSCVPDNISETLARHGYLIHTKVSAEEYGRRMEELDQRVAELNSATDRAIKRLEVVLLSRASKNDLDRVAGELREEVYEQVKERGNPGSNECSDRSD